MALEMEGRLGSPALKLAHMKKDGRNRTKWTGLFKTARKVKTPKSKLSHNAAAIKIATLKKKAELPEPKPICKTATQVAAPQRGMLSAPRQTVSTVPPATTRTPPNLADLSTRTQAFLRAVARRPEKQSAAEFAQWRADILAQRSAALAEVQKALVTVEQTPADADFVKNHCALMSIAVDLAFPVCANARKAAAGEATSQFLAQYGLDEEDAALEKLHDTFAAKLSAARLRLAGPPEERAKVTGRFLKAIADSPLVQEAASPAEKLGMATEILSALSKGDGSMMRAAAVLNTNTPETRAVLTGLRARHYADVAALRFVAQLDDNYTDLITHLKAIGRAKDERTSNPIGALSFMDIEASLPDPLKADFGTCLRHAKEAAQARDAYETQKERTIRALGLAQAEKAEAALLWRLAGGRHGTAAQPGRHIAGDHENVVGMVRAMADKSRPAAFQIAKLGLCIERLAQADRRVVGFNQFGLKDGQSFDAAMIMDVTGVTQQDAGKLGYIPDDVDNFAQNLARLGDTGLRNVGEAAQALRKVHGAAQGVLKNRDVQDNLRADLDHQTRALASLIRNGISHDAIETLRSHAADVVISPEAQTARLQAFRGIGAAVFEALFKGESGTSALGFELGTLKQTFRQTSARLVGLGKQLSDLEGAVNRQQAVLAAQDGDGRGINLEKSAGLQSAKLILQALALQTAYERRATNDDDAAPWLRNVEDGMRRDLLAERDAILHRLKGLNPEKLRRPWYAGSVFHRGRTPTIDDLRGLADAAKAVVFLRETAPRERASIQNEISNLRHTRDDVIDTRFRAAPCLFATVNRIIRTAIIEHMPADAKPDIAEGQLHPVYDMTDQRDAIVDTLTDWGLDTEAFAPEIDDALAYPIDSRVLRRWEADARNGSFADLLEIPAPDIPGVVGQSRIDKISGAFSGMYDFLANKRRINAQVRAELGALFDTLPKGSKFDIKAGTEYTINTRRIPLDPTATARLRARCAFALMGAFQVEVGSKGEYKIAGLSGAAVKAGLDFELSAKLVNLEIGAKKRAVADIRVGARVGGDLSAERYKGVEFVFPPGKTGKAQAIDFIMALTEDKPPSARMFEMADSVMDFSRNRKGHKIGTEAFARAEVSITSKPLFDEDDGPVSSGAQDKHGAGVEATMGAARKGKRKDERRENLDTTIVKSEHKAIIEVKARTALYARTYTALGIGTSAAIRGSGLQDVADARFNDGSKGQWDGGAATTPMDVASLGVTQSITTTRKTKFEYSKMGTDGQEWLKKAELKELTDGGPTTRMKDTLQAIFSGDTLEALAPEDREETRAQIRNMMKEMGRIGFSNAMFQVTYQLKPAKMALVNTLQHDAQVFRASGAKMKAAALDLTAKRILDDRENYKADKIALLDKTYTKSVTNRGNAMVARIDKTSQVESERTVVAVKL